MTKEKIPNNPKFFGKIDPDNFSPVAKNPIISKLMLLMGMAEEIGSGMHNVKKYLPHYAPNATYEFIDDDFFSTVIYLNERTIQKSSQKILQIIRDNSHITTEELAQILGISRRAVAKHIAKLKDMRKLERIGPDRGGYWKIIDNDKED